MGTSSPASPSLGRADARTNRRAGTGRLWRLWRRRPPTAVPARPHAAPGGLPRMRGHPGGPPWCGSRPALASAPQRRAAGKGGARPPAVSWVSSMGWQHKKMLHAAGHQDRKPGAAAPAVGGGGLVWAYGAASAHEEHPARTGPGRPAAQVATIDRPDVGLMIRTPESGAREVDGELALMDSQITEGSPAPGHHAAGAGG